MKTFLSYLSTFNSKLLKDNPSKKLKSASNMEISPDVDQSNLKLKRDGINVYTSQSGKL